MAWDIGEVGGEGEGGGGGDGIICVIIGCESNLDLLVGQYIEDLRAAPYIFLLNLFPCDDSPATLARIFFGDEVIIWVRVI